MGAISRKNEITIPADVMHEAGLAPGDELAVRSAGPGRVELIRSIDLIDEYAGSLDNTIYPPGYLEAIRGGPE